MKKNYIKAEADLVIYEAKDIITLSVAAFDANNEDSIDVDALLNAQL